MANRRENCPSMVLWEIMRIKWTEHGKDQNQFEYVKTFFNTFISNHPGFQFTVAQKYDSLYGVGITWEQYDNLKLELERGSRGLTFPDINVIGYLDQGNKMKKSFSRLSEYRRYTDDDVRPRNQRIVRSKLQEAKQHYQQAQSNYAGGEKCILSFDIEVYEYDHDKMLEIGYIVARIAGSGSPMLTEKCHFIIQENLMYKNGKYCPDNRHGFRFGRSKTIPLQQAIESFREAVMKCTFLVGHCAHHDEDYLRNIGVDISRFGKQIMDTQQIEMHLETTREGHRAKDDQFFLRGLVRLLDSYSVIYKKQDLHNAGCDAYYTMKVFLRQMGCSESTVNALT